jgi:hypothetical protein
MQAQSAAEENKQLTKFIQMLAPHKNSFELLPQTSATASSIGRALSEDCSPPGEGTNLDCARPRCSEYLFCLHHHGLCFLAAFYQASSSLHVARQGRWCLLEQEPMP